MPSRLRFVEPALPGIKDSEPPHPPSGADIGNSGLGNTGGGVGMPGAWLEWSEAEDEEQGSGSERCRATEVQRRVVQTLGPPAAGWTKAGSLLGGGKVPLSGNTKLFGPGRAKQNRQRKQRMESGLLFSLPMVILLSSLLSALLSQISRLG